MPNWKKVITSGSDAILNSLNVTGSTIFGNVSTDTHQFTGSLHLSGSAEFTGSVLIGGPEFKVRAPNPAIYNESYIGTVIQGSGVEGAIYLGASTGMLQFGTTNSAYRIRRNSNTFQLFGMYSNTSAELSIGTNAAAKLGQATLYVGGDISGSGKLNIAGGISGSFSGSYQGDGSNLTGVGGAAGTVSGSAQIDHDATTNFVANEHIDWTGASAGTIHASNYTDTTTNTQLSQEQVEDYVGGMLGGTETGITVTYQDGTGDIDFVVAAQTANDFTTTLKNKLDAIEASADVTDTANVLANLPAGVVSSSAFPLGVNITGGAIITGSTSIYRSGSIGDTTVFTIEGGLGTLFSVTDELTGSLFSVNDISGIPMFEVFSYEQIKMGTFGAEGLRVSGSDAQTSGSLAVGPIVNSGVAGRIDASNDIVAYSTSDRRWKDNITPIESPLQKLLELGGYEFDWREDKKVHGNKGHDVGVIAQEVEAVLPEAVQTRSSGMKAVRYEKIIPLLIETIKEQQKQIDELKNRIK